MATIKDVAREAGVSIATVSNYLNQKANVSEQTALKIRTAIDNLHYVVQNSGRELRRKHSNVIGLIFPNISEPYFEKLVSSIKGYINLHGAKYTIEIFLTDNNPNKEREVLLNYIGRNISGIILYTCAPNNTDVLSKLANSGVPSVFIDRRPKGIDCNLIYLDNYNVFYQVTKYYLEHGYRNIALAIGPEKFDENRYAISGYRAAFSELSLEVDSSLIFSGEPLREYGFRIGMDMCQKKEIIPQIIISTSYKLAEGIRYAYHLNHYDLSRHIRIITTGDSPHDVFYFDREIIKTPRSAYEVGEQVCQLLLENIRTPYLFEKQQQRIREEIDLTNLTLPAGVLTSRPRPKVISEIHALMIDDRTAVSGISKLLDDFFYKTGICVIIEKILPEDMFDYLMQYAASGRTDIDVILFDVPWLHYLADQGLLLCLDELGASCHLRTNTYVPNVLNYYGSHKGRLYALPFMVCTQLLYYRADIFEDPSIKIQFENHCKLPLQPPVNWHQYNIIAGFFSQSSNGSLPVKYGHSMSLSYPEELICAIMPRLWERKSDLYDAGGRVHVNGKSMRKVVRNLLESVSFADPDVLTNKPIDSLNRFLNGEAAMVSMYYNYAMDIINSNISQVTDLYRYSKIPGNSVLAGWCLGLCSSTTKAKEAFQFIQWASGEEISIPHTILGGQSPHLSIYQNYDLVSLYPWLTKGLSELENARERKSPVNHWGDIANEKEVENQIYYALVPYIEQASKGYIASYAEIEHCLDALQRKLIKMI